MAIKRVAVIGLGPAGAITIDALAQEKAFDVIRVFERREDAGGCWLEDKYPPPNLDPSTFEALSTRTADTHIPPPSQLPARRPRPVQPRYEESSVYPYLETNIDSIPMSFSQEPIPVERSDLSISRHGADTPFRHHSVIQKYLSSLVNRRGYETLVSYNTTVELAEKVGEEWRLVLRRSNEVSDDEWWEEHFDAVIVASGHYNVPYIPHIPGLKEFEESRPGSVIHSKMFRGREAYRGKKVLVVGASVSAADIAYDLTTVAATPIHTVTIGHKPNAYFGDLAFQHPLIDPKSSISHITTKNSTKRTVHFIDGTSLSAIDTIIFGTGYSFSLPFLPSIPVQNNRIPNLYQHIIYTHDPTLLFIGAVAAGLTFKVFEWQAVLAARILSRRSKALPSTQEMQAWEENRRKERGDGTGFTLIYPHFEDYFEGLRDLAGVGEEEGGGNRSYGRGERGLGRRLPGFDREWVEVFLKGHERRKKWWREENERARRGLEGTTTEGQSLRAKL